MLRTVLTSMPRRDSRRHPPGTFGAKLHWLFGAPPSSHCPPSSRSALIRPFPGADLGAGSCRSTRRIGVTRVVMLTGDTPGTATAVVDLSASTTGRPACCRRTSSTRSGPSRRKGTSSPSSLDRQGADRHRRCGGDRRRHPGRQPPPARRRGRRGRAAGFRPGHRSEHARPPGRDLRHPVLAAVLHNASSVAVVLSSSRLIRHEPRPPRDDQRPSALARPCGA